MADQLRRVACAAETQAAHEYVIRYGRASMTPAHPELFGRSLNGDPRATSKPTFTVPGVAESHGTLGWVDAVFVIGANGQTHDAWSGNSVPQGRFDNFVRAALTRLRFEPGLVDGEPTAVFSQLRVKFAFRDNSVRNRPKLLALINELKKKADGGDADAQYILASLGFSYPELAPEIGNAVERRHKAAAAGQPSAEFDLGLCALHRSCDTTLTEGVSVLADAARKGSGTAAILLAFVCAAEGTMEGEVRAVRWLQIASAAGQGVAMKRLAHYLAASPYDEIRDAEGAERLTKSLRESVLFESDPDVWQISGAAAAARGDFQAAVDFQNTAIKKAAALGWTTQALRDRRDAFASKQDSHRYLLGTKVVFSGNTFANAPRPAVCDEQARTGSHLAICK